MITDDEILKQINDDIEKEDRIKSSLIKKTLWLLDDLTQKNYVGADYWIRQINDHFDELKKIINI